MHIFDNTFWRLKIINHWWVDIKTSHIKQVLLKNILRFEDKPSQLIRKCFSSSIWFCFIYRQENLSVGGRLRSRQFSIIRSCALIRVLLSANLSNFLRSIRHKEDVSPLYILFERIEVLKKQEYLHFNFSINGLKRSLEYFWKLEKNFENSEIYLHEQNCTKTPLNPNR